MFTSAICNAIVRPNKCTSVPQGITADGTIAEQDGSSSGFYPCEPGLVLVGSKQNVLTINIPEGLAAIQANSRVIVIFQGHLAQNVTPVR